MSGTPPRPDICFFKKEKADTFTPKQTLFPAPDLVVEILSESTKDRDRGMSIRGVKFKDYQAHQIQEYWIIDTDHQTIEQYHLVDGLYELILKSAEGHLKSFVMTGFLIPIQAIFDEAANVEAMKNLI